MNMKDPLSGILEKLEDEGIWGSAVIDREGNIIESRSLDSLNRTTFSIMSATIVGSAQTINSELKRGKIDQIVVNLEEGKLVIESAGEKTLLSAVVGEDEWDDETSQKIKRAAVEIRDME